MQNQLPVEKSEILFFYESSYSIPNGDPFTGEQRYDEETKSILVSDVRIKRFIRDYLADHLENGKSQIYVLNDATLINPDQQKDPESGAADRFGELFGDAKGVEAENKLRTLVDVRLFGGILTKKGVAINLTGPVQFALLNPSMNAVDLRMHQTTSVFASSTEKSRGAIGTTTVVPYALVQIHGWVNPYAAEKTGLSEKDLTAMFNALWDSVNNANTRSKNNQNSLLLLQVVYSQAMKKLYGLDRKIKLDTKEEKRGEQLRSSDDYDLNFDAFAEAVSDERVKEVRFYTEDNALKTKLSALPKFVELKLE